MNGRKMAIGVLALALAGAVVAGEATGFASKPVVERREGRSIVTFAVSSQTDVEVAVLAADGKVVRHLAAGVLGGAKPPPAPLKPGLSQSIEWDGKDDFGKVASGGPFTFRVRAGMRAELDGFLVENPAWFGTLRGLAVGANGDLYVYSSNFEQYVASRCLQVFSREGQYIRTIMPMPANLPRERLLPFNTSKDGKDILNVPGEHFYPRNYMANWPDFYGCRAGQMAPRLTGDGKLLIASILELGRVGTDGGAADKVFWRDLWKGIRPSGYYASRMEVVPSPDGKFVYYAGPAGNKGEGGGATDQFPLGRVFRMGLAEGGRLEPFTDIPGTNGCFHGNTIGGMDCDKDGNLLVCDWGGNRVRTFSPDGQALAVLDVGAPELVACHRKTGEVYIVSVVAEGKGGIRSVSRKLLKFSSWKADAMKLAEIDLPMRNKHNWAHDGPSLAMALDDRNEPASVWIGQVWPQKSSGARHLLRIDDQGGALVQKLNILDNASDTLALKPRLAVHPETDAVVYTDGIGGMQAVHGLTGERIKLPFEGGVDMNVGLDGDWYIQVGGHYSGYICRFDREFKPVPVANPAMGGMEGSEAARVKGSKEKATTNALGFVYGRTGSGHNLGGLAADRNGRVYSLQIGTWCWYCVAVFGPEGKPEDPGRMKDHPEMGKVGRFPSVIVGPAHAVISGVQVDWQGNIYVGAKVWPAGHTPAIGFEKNDGYRATVGSVIKFKADGGAILPAEEAKGKPGIDVVSKWGYGAHDKSLLAENAVNIYPDLGSMAMFGAPCSCRQPMFQVDGWGRIIYPNATTCSVGILDNSGNLIQRFGHYGNADSRGPGKDSMIQTPAVPLAWPQAVGASHKAIYVSDVANRRIMRLMKKYAAEETVQIK